MSSSSDSLPRFGRYEALFRIAAGGMAEVFAARIRGEAGFEKLVAVKRMLPHLVEDEHFVGMFLDEARVAVQVASPHVVQTLDLGRAEDGALYIAMELVVGCALSVLVREARKANQRVPLPIALEIIAQAAEGLDDAHEAVTPTGVHLGIVHRDVSPHNLLVGADGRTRVTDFGIARALMRRTSTAAGELKGKFAYFAPEQADGLHVDRRADVFALGICAWEAVVGRRLFNGDDMMQVLARVRAQEIPPLHEIDETVPRAVSEAIAKALARPVAERWQTAHAFASALREAARSLGPAPSAREIGKWVAEAGAEPLGKIRAQIDAALAGDDVETIAREPSRPSGSGSSRKPVSAPTAAPVVLVPVVEGEPSTLASTTLPSEGRGKGRRAIVVAVALAAAGGAGAVVWSMQPSPSTGAAAPVESAPFAPPEAPSASAPPSTSAPSTSASAPSANPLPVHKSKPKAVPVTKAAATAAEPTPTPTAAPPPPPPPAPAPPPKKAPTGPLLGDDAFKVPQ